MLPAPNQRLDDGRRTETPDRQDLVAIAAAFTQAPWAWQTVLWHSLAEGRTATEVSPLLGRSANDVTTTLLSAEAGLFELYLRADASRISDLDATSAALLPLIGGHRRGVLSPTDRRRVDELLERRTEGSPDGVHAQRWMAVGAVVRIDDSRGARTRPRRPAGRSILGGARRGWCSARHRRARRRSVGAGATVGAHRCGRGDHRGDPRCRVPDPESVRRAQRIVDLRV